MFDSLVSISDQELLKARLQQAEAQVRALRLVTKQDALATVYSVLNKALALGNNMSPLQPIPREGPAVAGDVDGNLQILNQDSQAIIQQLLDTEQEAASLYNLFASTQTSLRQLIRQKVYSSSTRSFREDFIDAGQIDQNNVTLDFNAGQATLPVLSSKEITPDSLLIGASSIGAADPTTALENLLDGNPDTSFRWLGPQLELLVSFTKPQILNYLRLELVGYQGLTLDTLTSSPDGILVEDLRLELPNDSISLDGSSGKFSGDWLAMIDPRHVTQLRFVIVNQIATNSIEIRNLHCLLRQFNSNGTLTSVPIQAPSGRAVVFRAQSHSVKNLTSVSHQISTDGFQYKNLTPGTVLPLTAAPYWYRAVLSRLDSNFSQTASPLAASLDSQGNPTYQVSSQSSLDLGGGILERTLNFNSISAVLFNELPLAGTLAVFAGAVTLPTSQYTLGEKGVQFYQPQTNITIRYQASAYGQAGIPARQAYYSPVLYEYSFSLL